MKYKKITLIKWKFFLGIYNCKCSAGWSGTDCETFNPCFNNPCQNSGVCEVSEVNKYTCECLRGYYGLRCQLVDPCLCNPCKNNGRCISFLSGNIEMYNKNIEREMIFKSRNESNNFQNFSTNFFSEMKEKKNYLSQYNEQNQLNFTYDCLCDPGYIGADCRYFNACLLKPCLNAGECLASLVDTTTNLSSIMKQSINVSIKDRDPVSLLGDLENTWEKSFKCNCKNGWYGNVCGFLNSCFSSPCLNRGVCSNTSFQGTFKCSCRPDYEGNTCEIFNPCKTKPCLNNAVCTVISRNRSYGCECAQNFYGSNCQFFNPCFTNPCKFGGTCLYNSSNDQNIRPSYKCLCNPGYTGNDCTTIDPCSSSPCVDALSCKASSTIPTSVNDYECECRKGFYGKTCSNFNPCVLEPCLKDGKCILSGCLNINNLHYFT